MLNSIRSEVDALTGSWRTHSNVAFAAAHPARATRSVGINNALKTLRGQAFRRRCRRLTDGARPGGPGRRARRVHLTADAESSICSK